MNKINVFAILIPACTLLSGQALAFTVMPSLNSYKQAAVDDAVNRAAELKSDGVWFITENSDLPDSAWRKIFQSLGRPHISEDNPDGNKSYSDYVRIMVRNPDASFCYNETGGLPGGTQLTDEQIKSQSLTHGNKPLVVLTRSYGGEWQKQTDRCLDNPMVSAICMEYVKEALLNNINAPAECIRAARGKNKPVYILLHAAGDGWTLEENKKIIENLNAWCPAEMAGHDVHLVYQNYGGGIEGWFGPGGVKEAIQQARQMPNYTTQASENNPAQ